MGRRNRRKGCLRAGAASRRHHSPLPRNPFPTRTGRRTLLASTALASTLVLGLVAPSPATAVDQNQNVVQTFSDGATDIVVNHSKIGTGIIGIPSFIDNLFINSVHTSIFANSYGAGVTGFLNQTVDLLQTNSISSKIDVTNTGDIDPDVGILGEINNALIGALINNAIFANSNVAGITIDVTQTVDADQANTIASRVEHNNTGNIVANDVGIIGEVGNEFIGLLFNNAIFANSNVGGIGRDLTQLIALSQANTIASTVVINNSGDIDPDIGIEAEIDNDLIGLLFNNAIFANSNVEGIGRNLEQSISLEQDNKISSSIAIVNKGNIDANGIGISSDIDNELIGLLFNNAIFANSNVEGIGRDLEQSIFLDQSNAIKNDVARTPASPGSMSRQRTS